jgi:hypothetical protein
VKTDFFLGVFEIRDEMIFDNRNLPLLRKVKSILGCFPAQYNHQSHYKIVGVGCAKSMYLL